MSGNKCEALCGAMVYPEKYQVPEFELHKQDQGSSGSCVACAVTALFGYLCRAEKKKFSPEYLYARCKREDKDTSEGTGIENAFSCVKKYGLCLAGNWPGASGEAAYVPEEHFPDNLPVEDCSNMDFRMLTNPGNVEEYKGILTGEGGATAGFPIVAGCRIFTSGRKGNWLQEPAPGDLTEEGHAVLIYGWKDTPGLPSRGYFLAQNSSPDAVGDDGSGLLRIPYEYMEKYGVSAGTLAPASAAEGMICALPAEKNGGKSLSPEVPESPERVSLFGAEMDAFPVQEVPFGARSNFFSSIRENISKAPYFYPDLHMPFFKSLRIVTVNVEKVQATEEDCSNDLKMWLAAEKITAVKAVSLKLYWFELDSRNVWCFACAFFAVGKGEVVTEESLGYLQEYIRLTCCCRPSVKHLFFTFGTNGSFAPDCNTSANPTVILCQYREKDLWTHKLPVFERGIVGEEFLTHIMPGRYRKKLEEIIHSWSKYSDPQITVERLRDRMGFTEKELDLRSLETALDDIFASGDYARKKNGEIIPFKKWGELPPDAKKCCRYTSPLKKLKWIQFVLLSGTVLFALPAILVNLAKLAKMDLPSWGSLISVLAWVLGFIITRIRLRMKFRYNIN